MIMIVETRLSSEQVEYLNKLAYQKCRSRSNLIAYAIKRYCTTDGLKDENTGERVRFPDR
jgi:predicted transcriptional regulator